MEYRKLGKTNELISVLGYGASPLGNVFDVVDEQEGKNAGARRAEGDVLKEVEK